MENTMENIKSENIHVIEEFGVSFNKIERKLDKRDKEKVRFEEK